MKRELYIKCDKCLSYMNFDISNKSFICSNCNNKKNVNDIGLLNDTKLNSDDYENLFLDIKYFSTKYTKKDFIENVKREIKFKSLIPKKFLKLKKIREIDIKKIYIPFMIFDATIILVPKEEKLKDSLVYYEIKNMIIDDYMSIDKSIMNMLYPLDLDSDFELKNKNISDLFSNINDKNLFLHLENKVMDNIIFENNLNMSKNNYDLVFLKEKVEFVVLPIYDYSIEYNSEDYHISMNANTGKFYNEIPINYKKIYLIMISFLFIDVIFFYLSQLVRVIDEFTFIISVIIFIMQFLILWCLYLLSKKTYNVEINKNKIKIVRK